MTTAKKSDKEEAPKAEETVSDLHNFIDKVVKGIHDGIDEMANTLKGIWK